MKRKLIEQIKTMEALAPQLLKPGAVTPNGTAIDRLGYHSARFALQFGTTTSNNTAAQSVTGVLYDSTDGTSNFSAYCTATFSVSITANETGATTIDSATVDLAGAARYIQMRFTGTNTTTGSVSAPFSAVCVLGDAIDEPAV